MRDQFLLDPSVTFLNHGSFGACPLPVFEQFQHWHYEAERQPVEFYQRRYHALMDAAREHLAAYLHAPAADVIFVPNATAAINMVARSIALDPDDVVLTTDHEYGAMNTTWAYHTGLLGARYMPMPLPPHLTDPEAIVEAIWRGVTVRTKVIFMSHITSPTALILPVAAICRRAREAGILTVIDGAHVPGHLPLDLGALGADIYTGNCHKWLCAPRGAGFLYVHPDHQDWLEPDVMSWGWHDAAPFAERHQWQGTRDVAAYLSVPAAIDFQRRHDWASIQARCHDLAIYAMHRVCEMTGQMPYAMPRFFGQMVVAPLPPDCDPIALKQTLINVHRVEVPVTTQGNRHFLRISIAAYNTPADVEALLKALRASLS